MNTAVSRWHLLIAAMFDQVLIDITDATAADRARAAANPGLLAISVRQGER